MCAKSYSEIGGFGTVRVKYCINYYYQRLVTIDVDWCIMRYIHYYGTVDQVLLSETDHRCGLVYYEMHFIHYYGTVDQLLYYYQKIILTLSNLK